MRIISRYDMDPVYESDEFVLREFVQDAEAPKRRAKIVKAKPRKGVGVELLLDQEHMTHDGKIIVSHLIAVPRGEDVHWGVKAIFHRHPFSAGKVRYGWNIISDTDLHEQLPDHDIYWLCRSEWYTPEWVKAVVAAIYSEKPAPKREIKNKIPIGR